MEQYDCIVVGGGITGLAQTVALAVAGFDVACVDPAPSGAGISTATLDGRTTALLEGSVTALDRLDVWSRCRESAAALSVMRIVDEAGRPAGAPRNARFDAAEVGDAPFGYNVPNAALRRALQSRMAELPTARHFPETTAEEFDVASKNAVVVLSDGRTLTASLIVGADGKRSATREAANIKARQWEYGQTAMAFSIAHTRPHENVSVEFHRTVGPFVLVPLPGNMSSVVWVDRTGAARDFLSMPEPDFRRAVQRRTRGLLGHVTDVGPRGSYSAVSLIADNYVAPRLALIGEAAHATPPIGAQGLNLGLTDVAALAEVLADARGQGLEIGAPDVLARYERWRRPDIVARIIAIDSLNRAVKSRLRPVQALRHAALSVVDRVDPLKARLMRQGMTPVGTVPALMRRSADVPGPAG